MLLTRVRVLIDRLACAMQNVSERTRTARREAIAVVALCAGALTVLSLVSFRANDGSLNHVHGIYDGTTHNWVGPIGALWADLCLQVLGLLSWGLAAGLLYVGSQMLLGRYPQPKRRQVLTLAIFAVSVGTLIELLMLGRRMHYPLGGVFGAILARFLREHFAPVGAAVIAMTGAILAFPFGVAGMLSSLSRRFGHVTREGSEVLWHKAQQKLAARGLLSKQPQASLAPAPARGLPAAQAPALDEPSVLAASSAEAEAEAQAEAEAEVKSENEADTAAQANAQPEPSPEPEGFAAPPSWLLTPKITTASADKLNHGVLDPTPDKQPAFEAANEWPTSAQMAEQLAREQHEQHEQHDQQLLDASKESTETAEAAAHQTDLSQVAAQDDVAAQSLVAPDDAEAAAYEAEFRALEAQEAQDAAAAAAALEQAPEAQEDLETPEAALASQAAPSSHALEEPPAAQAAPEPHSVAEAIDEPHDQAPSELAGEATEAGDLSMQVQAGAARQEILADPSDAYAVATLGVQGEVSTDDDDEAALAGGPNLAGSADEALAASDALGANAAHDTWLSRARVEPAELVYEAEETEAPAGHEDGQDASYVYEGRVATSAESPSFAAAEAEAQAQAEADEAELAMATEDEGIDEDELLAAEEVEEQDFDGLDEGDELGEMELSGAPEQVGQAQAVPLVPQAAAVPYALPPTSLLHFEATAHAPVAQPILEQNAERLEATLRTYGIDGHVREIRPGPVVTMYEYVPGPGIKLARIASLADDLAMSMEALRVRIVAPIPGKGAVGIEIPNEHRDTVHLKEIVEHPSFAAAHSPLSCALGKDIEGSPVTKNLAHMPHLLVAGATGAGKSVSVNAMIMSLLFKATPDEVRMIMVDPKMLELSVYEGIPHLMLPVVTDPKKAALALRWAVEEMERRYELLSEVGVRSIDNFNSKVRAAAARGESVTVAGHDADMPRKACETLPYILVIVDELADLMMVASREVETSIMRLAQMARAAGIHLILATQRPSVDVITGVIKANFPSRIAFQVASRHDSRTIIDSNGAENLLGRGDMLLMSHAAGGLQRIHGAFVGEDDIERTVAYVKAQAQPQYDESILLPRNDEMAQSDDQEFDEMYDQAVAVVAETQQASVSMIQRRMRIGYNRAARMVDRMEREGVVGPGDGARPREVLVSQSS